MPGPFRVSLKQVVKQFTLLGFNPFVFMITAVVRDVHLLSDLREAQLPAARHVGISSWRQLKAEVEKCDMLEASPFFDPCASGAVEHAREMVAIDARKANAIDASAILKRSELPQRPSAASIVRPAPRRCCVETAQRATER